MALFKKERLGIDLGTANTVIYLEGKGIVLREPSLIAINLKTNEIEAYGKEASNLIGKTTNQYDFIYPIQNGVIYHFSYAKQLLEHFIRKASIRSLGRTEAIICAPSKISKVERQTFIEVVKDLGIYRAMIVDEPFAAAVGSDIDILQPVGRMLVDIGGGTTDIATISYGELVHKSTLSIGGKQIDQLISMAIRQKMKVIVSDQVAEEIKIELSNANYGKDDLNKTMKIKGLDLASRTPIEKEITEKLVAEAIDEGIIQISEGIKDVLSLTPPELAADILTEGIYLSGGGALLKRLPERLTKEIGLPVQLVKVPMDSVAVGAGKLFDQLHNNYQRIEKNNR